MPAGSPLLKSLIFGALIATTVTVLSTSVQRGTDLIPYQLGWSLFVGGIGFAILRTGLISRWRSLFFILMAWGFVLNFKSELIGIKSAVFACSEQGRVPFCHIAMASSFFNYLYQQYLALKSGSWLLWGPLTLGVLWLVVTLSLGQAWCSWACFYGGLDEGFSRVLKKPIWAWTNVSKKLRDFPSALLLFLLLVSLTVFLPVYCLWLCPLKITDAFLDTHGAVRMFQKVFFISIGVLAIGIVPLLTRKRTFCAWLCPFGAWQAFWGRLNPLRVTILPDRCVQCGDCARVCPIFAIEVTEDGPKVLPYCNRCGECLDICARGGIRYTLLGGTDGSGSVLRTVFIGMGLVVGGAVGGLFMPEVFRKIVFWIGGR